MFVVDRFDITPGWSNRTLLINNLNKHHEVSEKSKILQMRSMATEIRTKTSVMETKLLNTTVIFSILFHRF